MCVIILKLFTAQDEMKPLHWLNWIKKKTHSWNRKFGRFLNFLNCSYHLVYSAHFADTKFPLKRAKIVDIQGVYFQQQYNNNNNENNSKYFMEKTNNVSRLFGEPFDQYNQNIFF